MGYNSPGLRYFFGDNIFSAFPVYEIKTKYLSLVSSVKLTIEENS